MERIEWNSSFSVGVEALDDQHKRIVRMINLLIADSGATVRSETISELLGRLTQYSDDHFQTEERFLEEYGYPDRARHKEEHRAYRIKVVALCSATVSHDDSVPAELLEFLGHWWKDHILESDMKYRPFLAERGVT